MMNASCDDDHDDHDDHDDDHDMMIMIIKFIMIMIIMIIMIMVLIIADSTTHSRAVATCNSSGVRAGLAWRGSELAAGVDCWLRPASRRGLFH